MTPWPRLTLPTASPTESPTALPPADAARPAPRQPVPPFVTHASGLQSLHFTLSELQSCMAVARPWQLAVDYTRTMMAFLLLQPQPARIAMVGLGGGSLAKFCFRHLPMAQITVLEINPHVIALRRVFGVPDDDARFRVIEGDGAAWLADRAGDITGDRAGDVADEITGDRAAEPGQGGAFDVLLIDGFDHEGQCPALCTQAFYDDCARLLAPGGALVVNLHADDADFALWAARIRRSFAGNAVELPSVEKSNCILLACRADDAAPGLKALSPRGLSLQRALQGLQQLEALERQPLKAELARVLWLMKDLRAD